jgi:hypothetical protein
MTPVDLTRRRSLSELLSSTWDLWTRHLTVFFTLALVVVAPVGLLVDGIWGGALADVEATPPIEAAIVSGLLNALIVPAIVTAVHVVAVLGLGRGEEPSVGGALRGAAPAFLPVVVVMAIYSIGTGLLLVLLIVPGIWFATRYYFGAQAAIVDGERAVGALSRSQQLTSGCWWRTFGCLIVFATISFVITLVLGIPVGLVAGVADSGPILVVGTIVGQALALSYSALAGTMLFFDLRARKSLAWDGAPTRPLGSAPERPSSA